jgi:hypothetical protein
MNDPDELALVEKALKCGLDGCVEWDHYVVDRVRRDLASIGESPESVKERLIRFAQGGGNIRQIEEKRSEWKNRRDYYYKAILPVSGLKKGLFVEIVLHDADPEYPEILLVNTHEQT